MDKKEILKKIDEIKAEIDENQLEIIRQKILERPFHLHKSDRSSVIGRVIERIRKRIILEVSLLLEPLLENQKEVNLRFLREIEKLKREAERLESVLKRENDGDQHKKSFPQD